MKSQLWKSLYFSPLFFGSGAALIFLFAFGFVIPPLFVLAQVLLALWLAFSLADAYLLFKGIDRLAAQRKLPKVLGLSDHTEVHLTVTHHGKLSYDASLYEELPEQLQNRDFRQDFTLKPGTNHIFYHIKPVDRGIYAFGNTQLMIQGPLKLLKRKMSLSTAQACPVYPSIQHMREMSLHAFNRNVIQQGAKQLLRVGRSYEFEQIKPFVEGDDFRSVNWKATGKTRELMVNQFQDERSQNLYCVISKGRAMRLSFDGMSLLDYAINTTLAISNIALKKYDKVGLITFSDVIGTAMRAENRKGQLNRMLEALYAEKERDLEPSYELLYKSLDRLASNRSMVLLFANFTTLQMLERVLPILTKIHRKHMLVVVLFKDKSLDSVLNESRKETDDVYRQTIALKFLSEREDISRKLRSRGIQAILATPEQLSVQTINKYLELKRRGMI